MTIENLGKAARLSQIIEMLKMQLCIWDQTDENISNPLTFRMADQSVFLTVDMFNEIKRIATSCLRKELEKSEQEFKSI